MRTIRPEGPTFNSHAREGVDPIRKKYLSAEGAAVVDYDYRTFGASNSLWAVIHALTGVAIKCRPFGPNSITALTVVVST